MSFDIVISNQLDSEMPNVYEFFKLNLFFQQDLNSQHKWQNPPNQLGCFFSRYTLDS